MIEPAELLTFRLAHPSKFASHTRSSLRHPLGKAASRTPQGSPAEKRPNPVRTGSAPYWQNCFMSEIDSADMGPWLSPEDLEFVRQKVPMVYVEIVPVRVDDLGSLEAVGMLLCVDADSIVRTFPSGRVLYHETMREALLRHIEKDLGPVALPQLPPCIAPFTVSEYFPTPGAGWYDERQHAIALAYIVPMHGDCNPGSDSLELTWFTPGEARTPELQNELAPGHAALLRQAMARMGEL